MKTTIDLFFIAIFLGMEIYYYFSFRAFARNQKKFQKNLQNEVYGRLENIESMLYEMNEMEIQEDSDIESPSPEAA